MAKYAIEHNFEVNLVVEHVSVGVPNVIDYLPGAELVKEDQVQKGDTCAGEEVLNEVCQDGGSDQNVVGRAEVFNGVTSEDKGKTTEVADEVGDLNQSLDSGSESGESIDSLNGVCFEDSEEERNLGNDDGFGDLEIPIPHNEGTSHNMPTSQNEGNSQSQGTKIKPNRKNKKNGQGNPPTRVLPSDVNTERFIPANLNGDCVRSAYQRGNPAQLTLRPDSRPVEKEAQF
ncbi:hypothetical protein SESBI_01861 [Sesbania bispinosa]|nr:hypothetical protein SESBI_01861 [Sesbania bispinosa]